jgi:hypothetical protein
LSTFLCGGLDRVRILVVKGVEEMKGKQLLRTPVASGVFPLHGSIGLFIFLCELSVFL